MWRTRLAGLCFSVAVIAAVAILCAAGVPAQMNSGEISGTVKDASGGLVAGATVIAIEEGSGARNTSTTNAAGEYLFPQLAVGSYRLTADRDGFKQSVINHVQVHIADKLRYEFNLEVGDRNEVLTIEAAAASVQLESAEIKDVIQQEQVIALPLRTRQFLDLAILSEGVVRPPGGTRGDALQQAGTLVNVLGQRSGHNLYLVDGVSVTDQHFNNMVIAPSVDSIQEFNIDKTSYAPEFGGKSGAVINVVTKSGSNGFHGSLFEFVRNDIFDAKNFFDSPTASIPPFRQNQFGGTIGGPIVKEKTFFFLSYEGQRVRKSLTQAFTVPTEQMRAGIFPSATTIYDPVGGARTPFTGNQIPATRFDPVAVVLLDRIPHENRPGNPQNFLSVGTQSSGFNAYSGRLDHHLTDDDTLYSRVSIFDAKQFDPFGSGVLQEALLPGFGRNLRTHTVNVAAGWSHIFTSNVLNEFRFGWMDVRGGQTSPNAGFDFAAVSGLQGVTTNPLDMGFPNVSFGGSFASAGDPNLFTIRQNRNFEFYDNVVWHKGKHIIKFGAYWFHFDFQPANPTNARGTFNFTPRWTSAAPGDPTSGSAFADFLLGFPTQAQVGIGRAAMDAYTNWLHLYIQDNWQITPSLKLDIGLRYEYNQNMIDRNNQMALIDNISVLDTTAPDARFVIASDDQGNLAPSAAALLPLIPIPYVSSAAAGYDRSLLTPRNLRLAPRIGLAWNPMGYSKTVVRSGFGIYPNQAAYGIIGNLAQNLPFFYSNTVNTSGTAVSPALSTPTILNSTGTTGGANLNHKFKVEYNEVWNLNVEHQVASNSSISAAYIGSRTVQADSATILNVPEPGPGSIAGRRPIQGMSQFTTIRWDGWATYHAFMLKYTQRPTRGLFFNANWTWSHAHDDASDPGPTLYESNFPQNVRDMKAEKADSSFDHRHRFVASFVYNIPLFQNSGGLAETLLANWQASGSFTAQTGAPFTVNTTSDPANIGAGPAQRPNISGDPNGGPKTPNQWFDPSVFSIPATFTFGNMPRNSVVGPGQQQFDLSMQKEFLFNEATKLQFRAEAYNLFNHPNFNLPNRFFSPTSTAFGRISSAQDSRVMQFALRLVF